jgi:hypothetical protein
MSLVFASCCGSPQAEPLPTDIIPWLGITICCGLLLMSEASVFFWRLRRAGAPHPWRRWRVFSFPPR